MPRQVLDDALGVLNGAALLHHPPGRIASSTTGAPIPPAYPHVRLQGNLRVMPGGAVTSLLNVHHCSSQPPHPHPHPQQAQLGGRSQRCVVLCCAVLCCVVLC